MPANQGMTPEEIKGYVKRKLGHGIIAVELTPDHMEDVIRDTRRWFINRVGVEVFFSVQVGRHSSTYVLPDHVVDVYDVWLPNSGVFFPSVGADDFQRSWGYAFGAQYSRGYGSRNGGNPGTGFVPGQDQAPNSGFLQALQQAETLGRLWGMNTDFLYEPRTRTLNLMPAPVNGVAVLRINSTIFDTTQLDPEEEDLFIRWALACAKETLGRIRSKYDSVPTVGGDRSLDGIDLVSEAESEKEKLETQAMDRKTAIARFIVVG